MSKKDTYFYIGCIFVLFMSWIGSIVALEVFTIQNDKEDAALLKGEVVLRCLPIPNADGYVCLPPRGSK